MKYPTAIAEPYVPLTWEGFTKKDLAAKAEAAVTNLLEVGAPERMAEVLAAMEGFVKGVKDDERYKQYLQDVLTQNSGKFNSVSGAIIETMEGGTKYHYDNCGDQQLRLLEIELENKTEEVKQRKEFLKTLPSKGLEVLTNDGEIIMLYPPYKTSVTTYKVTLAK